MIRPRIPAARIAARIAARRADLDDPAPEWLEEEADDLPEENPGEEEEFSEEADAQEAEEEDLPEPAEDAVDREAVAELDEQLSYVSGLVDEAKQHLDNSTVHGLMTSHLDEESAAQDARRSIEHAVRVISDLADEVREVDEAARRLVESWEAAEETDPEPEAEADPIAARIAARRLRTAGWDQLADEGQNKRLEDLAATVEATQEALAEAGKILGKVLAERSKAVKNEDAGALEAAMKRAMGAAEAVRRSRAADLAETIERVLGEAGERDRDILDRLQSKSKRF